MANKKSLSKATRFEVFKRDSFKCQYCGAAAPDVLLQVDHIHPKTKGGGNELMNLVTACSGCNLGKSDRSLDDRTAVVKQHAQLEVLQERREQLEMMMNWKQGLNELKEGTVAELSNYWHGLALGFIVNENGKRNLHKWLATFEVQEILNAMDIAARQYLEFTQTGVVTKESWEAAFTKIPGICRVTRASLENPEIRELYYIRGIARNNCSYFKAAEAMEILKAARSWNVPMDDLRQAAVTTTSWTRFTNDVYDMIECHRAKVDPLTPAEAAL